MVPQDVKAEFHDPTIPLLGTCPKGTENRYLMLVEPPRWNNMQSQSRVKHGHAPTWVIPENMMVHGKAGHVLYGCTYMKYPGRATLQTGAVVVRGSVHM